VALYYPNQDKGCPIFAFCGKVGNDAAPAQRSWEGPGFSRAVTIAMTTRALAPERPAYATEKTSAPEIESQQTARRRGQAGVFPTERMRFCRGKILAQRSSDGPPRVK
jgi:hypothetical protein